MPASGRPAAGDSAMDEATRKQATTTQQGLDLYQRNRLAPGFFVVLFLGTIAALTYTLSTFLHDIVLALVLVAMFQPLYLRLCRGLRGRRWLAAGIVTTTIIVLVAAPTWLLATALLEQAQVVYAAGANSLDAGLAGDGPLAWAIAPTHGLLTRLGVEPDLAQLRTLLEGAQTRLQEGLLAAGGSVLSNLLALLLHASVLVMLVLYLLIDSDRLRAFAFKLSPLPDDEDAMLVERFAKVAKGTLVGNGLGSVAQGALCGIAMGVVGLPSPLFWAAIMSVLAFLPMVGVSIVVIPWGIYLLLHGSVWSGSLFLAFCLGQALLFENVVKSRLIGIGAAMPDLLAFLAVIGGLSTFGLLGLLYGPLIATAFLTLTDLYFERYQRTMALNFIGRGHDPPT